MLLTLVKSLQNTSIVQLTPPYVHFPMSNTQMILNPFIYLLQKPTPSYLHIHASSDPSVCAHQRSLLRGADQRRDPRHRGRGRHLQREDPRRGGVDHATVRCHVHLRITQRRHLCVLSTLLRRRQEWTLTSCDITHRCQAVDPGAFTHFYGEILF